ncbi:GBS Bsp-like repeat-containing protein [Streptococcus suis]|uniref:GBS Bsp-like repeat-containing protein n=1 Tax=Streptococcus suis TaxID=1307 RepID=UPI0021192DD5|nr:GBS Bsp-like repeat-containing protein [Streptococcus suis]
MKKDIKLYSKTLLTLPIVVATLSAGLVHAEEVETPVSTNNLTTTTENTETVVETAESQTSVAPVESSQLSSAETSTSTSTSEGTISSPASETASTLSSETSSPVSAVANTTVTTSASSTLGTATSVRNAPAPKQEIVSVQQREQNLELKYNLPISSGEVVRFAVWSDKNSQDDIIWYSADQTGAAYVELKKHKDYGLYHIHTYSDRSGHFTGLNATSINVAAPKPVSSKAVLKTESSFEVTITDVPSHISSVSVPIWSDNKGQDDIIWYTAQKRADGSYGVLVDTQKHKTDIGTYHIHVYGQNSQTGKLEGLSATSLTVPARQTTKPVSAKAVLKTESSFEVSITDVPSHISSVSVPIWSDNKGQDDIIWYTAQKRADGSYGVLVDTQKHKTDTGTYHIHVYGQNSQTGKLEGLSATSLTVPARQTTKPVSSKAVLKTESSFEVTITDVPSHISSVSVPIWSENKGQDDIIWYTAKKRTDGSYGVLVDTQKHKTDTGTYHIHVYGQNNQTGKLDGLSATSLTVPARQITKPVSTKAVLNTESSFEVTIMDVPSHISSVSVPVWSETKGQDDIIWYTAQKRADGSYGVLVDTQKHKTDTGTYHIHVYGQNSQTGKLDGLSATTITVPAPKATKPVSSKAVLKTESSFEVTITDVPSHISSVSVPVWSDNKGQDDIIWYTAQKRTDGSYGVLVDTQKHKTDTGTYHIHVYGQNIQTGKLDGLSATTVTVPKPQVVKEEAKVPTVTVTPKGAFAFDVEISNVSTDIIEVLFPVWSDNKGQDDIIWHKANRISAGLYKASIDLGKHNYYIGTYHIHVYGKNKTSDKLVGLGATSHIVPEIQTNASIHIDNVNNYNGTFDIVVSNIKSTAKPQSIEIPVWSEKNGQDDIKWYQAQAQANGTYKVKVFASDHKYSDGLYHAHLYFKNSQGNLEIVTATTTSLALEAQSEKQFTVSNRTFTIYGKYNPTYSVLQSLANTIINFENQGYSIGFKLMDADSNKGIAYNQQAKFYSASTIKGPFVASLAANNSTAVQQVKSTMLDVLRTSSNDGYKYLRDTYGPNAIYNWAKESGVDPNVVTPLYPYLAAQELFALWQRNYKFFVSNNFGKQVGTWFENPNLSPIKATLGTTYKTQSKAGWIGYPGYRSASDAGIVYTPQGNYILSVMTNADGRLGLVNPTVQALNSVYHDIKK